MLYKYLSNSTVTFPFHTPAIWTDVTSHAFKKCYFCSINRVSGRKKQVYFSCANCILPTKESILLKDVSSTTLTESSSNDDDESAEFLDGTQNVSKAWSANDFHDFCRELNLSKKASVKCLSMLKSDVDIAAKLKDVTKAKIKCRSQSDQAFFNCQDEYTFCNDVPNLLNSLPKHANEKDWSLFIDSSNSSLKAALICEKHELPTIPIAYARIKESKESVHALLSHIKYENFCFPIVADLKVINFLLGFKSGFSKFPCYYCMFDSRNSSKDFQSDFYWPERPETECHSVVNKENIIFPFLHIKLGLFQKFVKSMDPEGSPIQYLINKSMKSSAKILNGVFTGPEIRRLLTDSVFISKLNSNEKQTFDAFKLVCHNVLGKNVSSNWPALVNNLIQCMQISGCKTMSNKMHLLFKHKEKYEPFLGKFSDEHGERLHKDMEVIEKRYGERFSVQMLAEYIWSLKREGSFTWKTSSVCLD